MELALSEGRSEVVLDNHITDITSGLMVWSDLTLDLNGHNLTITLDTSTGNNSNGIKIVSGAALTIKDSSSSSNGKLTVTNNAGIAGNHCGAAINTTEGSSNGDGALIIESGTVIATSSSFGAGIGGGYNGAGGTVTINGGTVTAYSYYGAGIGGGYNGAGGRVTINGGTVTATGEEFGAGVGGGRYGAGGTVTINGGTVTATGEYDGAGIGGGYEGAGGTVTINGGSVNANNMDLPNAAKPINGNNVQVYLNELTIPEKNKQALSAASIGGVSCAATPNVSNDVYGIRDVSTDSSGKLYFYLLPSAESNLVSATVNGIEYGAVYRRTDDTTNNEHTLEPIVTSISIKIPPTKTVYKEGESLDLTGLEVTLHKSDGTEEIVPFDDFNNNGITTFLADNTELKVSDTTVTIEYTAYNDIKVELIITVNPFISATISPTDINYDLNSPAEVDTTITWNDASMITDVVYNTNHLRTPEDYDVSGNALSITSSYIESLGLSESDEAIFAISFDKGDPATLNVSIVDGYIPSSDALLNSLTVDGNSVSGFDPNITEYNVKLPCGTSTVRVDAVPEDNKATVVITQADVLPGDARVTVTAEDGISTQSYLIHFTVAYQVTVEGSYAATSGAGSYFPGDIVTVNAGNHIDYTFSGWTSSDGITFADASSMTTSFTMPESNVTVKANFEEIPAVAYQVTVEGSNAATSGAGSYFPGDVVTINAGNRYSYTFSGWTSSDGIIFANASSMTTSFTMPESNVTVTARWSYRGDSSNSDTTTNNINPSEDKQQPETKLTLPTIGSETVDAKKGVDNSATARIYKKTIINAIKKAQAGAEEEKQENGIGVSLLVNSPAETESLTIILTPAVLTKLINASVSQLDIYTGLCNMNFDLEALKEILGKSSENITISITPVTNLDDEADNLIGSRPVYNISISYMKNGELVNITSLGSGSVTLSLPYMPDANEGTGYLFGVYVDEDGNASRINNSAYDENSKSIIFDSNHFSIYGVGYTEPMKKFKDISSHFAKESIEYVVSRGLLSGRSTRSFSPDTGITRELMATALGILAGVDVNDYEADSFSDVEKDSPYAPYIEWAYKNDIISSFSNDRFVPNRLITREEAALILTNYAKATGYTLSLTRESVEFVDSDRIGSKYEEAVKAMQQAGIMMGESGNHFNPKAYMTRAQASAMLHRYIKLTIDPASSQKWTLNDSGQRLYYMDTKALIGLQTIGSGDDKKHYYFNTDGVMIFGTWMEIEEEWYYFNMDGSLAVSTIVDGYELDVNGVRKAKSEKK